MFESIPFDHRPPARPGGRKAAGTFARLFVLPLLAVLAAGGGPAAARGAAKPDLSVSASGSGAKASFTVTGSGFKPGAQVRIRVADLALQSRSFLQSANAKGKLKAKLSFPVLSGRPLYFSATDGRPDRADLTGVLWSNTVTVTAP